MRYCLRDPAFSRFNRTPTCEGWTWQLIPVLASVARVKSRWDMRYWGPSVFWLDFPSLLWHCWLSSIWQVKNLSPVICIVLTGGSRKLYISASKVIELWIETRAVISWVRPTTAFLMRQLIVASRLGRTEYQLLLMKIWWWDRNVKIGYKCLVVIDEFLTVSLYQPNGFISWK